MRKIPFRLNEAPINEIDTDHFYFASNEPAPIELQYYHITIK